MSFWPTVRLIMVLMLFAVASLIVVPSPTIPLFIVSLIAREFGHWLFILPLIFVFVPAPRTHWQHLATALAVITSGLFLSPAVRASIVARNVSQELARISTGTPNAPSTTPFSWKKLWLTPTIKPVRVETHTYANHDHIALRLYLYQTTQHHPAPCVVIIHGGGWENGSADECAALNHYLARRGYTVAAIEYRLAPQWKWPTQRDDVLEALQYLRERASDFAIDPERFVLLGRSAGGQIAEAVAYGSHLPSIRGCIAFYSPADMHFAYQFARADDILDSLRLLKDYLGGTPEEVPGNYDSASGILLAEPNSPPTLLIHGQKDELVWFRQSERLAERLNALGAPNCFVRLPWATHVFDINMHGPGGQISTYAVETFLGAVTR